MEKINFWGSLLFLVMLIIIYVVNFIQLIIALDNADWNLAIIKAIGVFTFLGSVVTVWF